MELMKLGKRPARYDTRTLKLSDYLVKIRSPPDEVSWVTEVPSWPMLGNDVLGDCVEAAMGHCLEQWSTYANPPGIVPSDNQVIDLYSAIAGYVPGDPSTDNGTVMLDALNYWRQTGFAGHKILAFVALNTRNLAELQAAIWLFGNAFIGIQLPVSAQGQSAWLMPDGGIYSTDGVPGSWGGHCVPVVARSPHSITVVTWGQRLKMSDNFYRAYCDEAYAILSTDWLESSGASPGSFNLDQLKADLQSITQV
jgi:hypothetical protein